MLKFALIGVNYSENKHRVYIITLANSIWQHPLV